MKHLRRLKRIRDRKKRDEKVLKSVDGFILTAHAVERARERSVGLHNIKSVLKNGTVEQTGAKTFRVAEGGYVVVFSEKCKGAEKGGFDIFPSHLTVITTWGNEWKEKQKKQKRKAAKKKITLKV